jgi:hypothetical protein
MHLHAIVNIPSHRSAGERYELRLQQMRLIPSRRRRMALSATSELSQLMVQFPDLIKTFQSTSSAWIVGSVNRERR